MLVRMARYVVRHKAHMAAVPTRAEELRLELYEKINALGIGAQGLGGLTTVLDVKVKDFPTHAANKAVAIIPNCAATRHVHFTLDGSGPAKLSPPSVDDWPEITREAGADVLRVNLRSAFVACRAAARARPTCWRPATAKA